MKNRSVSVEHRARVAWLAHVPESCGSVELLACMPYVRLFISARNSRFSVPLSQSELDDVAQEVFLRVWHSRSAFKHQAALRTWVGRFCLLVLNEELRRRRARATFDVDEQELPSSPFPCVEGLIDLRQANFLLSECEARAVVLRLNEGLTFADAASRMGCSQATVKLAYRRALERLRYQVSHGSAPRPVSLRATVRIALQCDGSLKLEPVTPSHSCS
jgi:RNA polymerase sigma factor (sigma-70 family)